MGVDFSHCDASWAYSGFNRFRARLANQIGIVLDDMDGFNRNSPDYSGVSWNTVKDPIKGLLNHSDCDGHITPKQCQRIAPRLRELVSSWEDCYDKQMAISLADGMDEAAMKNENLEFQ